MPGATTLYRLAQKSGPQFQEIRDEPFSWPASSDVIVEAWDFAS
jgi:hypothetical protein